MLCTYIIRVTANVWVHFRVKIANTIFGYMRMRTVPLQVVEPTFDGKYWRRLIFISMYRVSYNKYMCVHVVRALLRITHCIWTPSDKINVYRSIHLQSTWTQECECFWFFWSMFVHLHTQTRTHALVVHRCIRVAFLFSFLIKFRCATKPMKLFNAAKFLNTWINRFSWHIMYTCIAFLQGN